MLDFCNKKSETLETLVQKAPDIFEYQIYLHVSRSVMTSMHSFPLLETIAYPLPINNKYMGIKEAIKKSASLD